MKAEEEAARRIGFEKFPLAMKLDRSIRCPAIRASDVAAELELMEPAHAESEAASAPVSLNR